MTPRSWLYVPGDRPDRIAKALASDADAVIIDLEDAVAPLNKAAAREHLTTFVGSDRAVWARINPGREGLADIAALAATPPTGVLLAKCETTQWIDQVADRLPPHVSIAALIESAEAVAMVGELSRHPRLRCCHLGEIDLLAELGGRPSHADQLLAPARTALVYASAAAGLEAPVAGVHVAIDDLDGLAASSRDLSALGFGGRAVIHPTHCPTVNAAFSPTDDDIAWARSVLDARGSGALRGADGTMVDEAVLRRARRLLERLER
jgi:citrate lyase subunit beta/citryl-CoA lyase